LFLYSKELLYEYSTARGCRYWRVPRIIPTMLGSGTRSGPGWGRGVPRHRSRISLGRCVLPSRV
jgi:hypothetical protein